MSTSISELMNSMGAEHSEGSTSASEMMPFGAKTGTGEIVPLQSVEIGSDLYAPLSTEISTPFISGETYLVNFNGTVYECEARKATGDMSEYTIIGNGAVFGDGIVGNNEPFSCDNTSGAIFLNTTEAGSFTVSISGKYEGVKPLDSKFIKKVVLYGANAREMSETEQAILYHDDSRTQKVTREELKEMLDSCASIKIHYFDRAHGENDCFISYVITEFDYWTVGFISRGFKEFELHTAEYEGGGGSGAPE